MGAAGTGGASARRRVDRHCLRVAVVALLVLTAFFAPGVSGVSGASVAAPNAAVGSGCAAPESHEELRPGRPDRERPRPVLPRPQRLAVEQPATGAGPAVPCAQSELAWTPVEALPHPLERIPIDRN